ncbi:MAG: GAF domain-containing protein [Candidatus Faecousia sp.]|nr:GAF domain-containing protein [Candidatus Faecousia sp.]
MDQTVNYPMLVRQLLALTEDVPYETANLANVSALLWQALPDINWAGFYKMEDGCLILGPFQGKPACIRIPLGRGVCGTAAAEDRVQLVPNVHVFPGHIACDSASNSEIVVPLHKDGNIWGVLDIDSPTVGRFTAEDRAGLELVAAALEERL